MRSVVAAILVVGSVGTLATGCGRSQLFDPPVDPLDGGAPDAEPDVFVPCADEPGLPGDPCTVDNELGSCPGSFVCDDKQLVCRAPRTAEPESCNGIDDDCDGDIDEVFAGPDGRFTRDDHCGTCNNDCRVAFPSAAEVACDADRDPPACIITRCQAGFTLVSDTLCVPLQRLLCLPCSDDDDCVASPGARCLPVTDPDGLTRPRVCAQDCSGEAMFGACPTGFECASDPFGPDPFDQQCLPIGGSCACATMPEGSQLPCSIIGRSELTGEPISCPGFRTCMNGEPGDCELPPEECDGVDQDCNGRIDDPFRDAVTGVYDQDPLHCGFCGNDCTAQTFANAATACIGGDQGAPRCGPLCFPGFFDVDDDESTGCECELLGPTDFPDPAGVDANCDGIDGEIEQSYFVATTGSDTNPGTIDAPFRTVQRGVDRARADGKRDVLVAQGVYGENVVLRAGVNVYGGYSQDFTTHDFRQLESVVFGQPLTSGQRGAVTAGDITQRTTFDGFTVFGIDAASVGESTYAVSIVDSTRALRVTNNRIVAGAGAPGRSGTRGDDGGDGASGTTGRDGVATGRDCSLTPLPGGAAGTSSCEGVSTSGGIGGESHCPITERLDGTRPCDGTDEDSCKNTWDGMGTRPPPPPSQGRGQAGRNGGAPGGGPTYDRWTNTNQCFLCGLQGGWPHIGEAGADGADGADGAAGAGCFDANGTAIATGWVGLDGASGTDGAHGGGAGGGSSGSGFDITPGASGGTCQDRLGGSGGGGGAGGCRGRLGTGGAAGGGSFGIWIGYTRTRGSLPDVRSNVVLGGTGGDGGAGGVAGSGGLGGLGGNGGVAQPSVVFCAESGGRGGNGGDGGHGGGGGGGCGGVAFGIAVVTGPNSFSIPYDSTNTFMDGTGGAAGPGGGSLGNAGTAGREGASGTVISF